MSRREQDPLLIRDTVRWHRARATRRSAIIVAVTTDRDHGDAAVAMLRCPVDPTGRYRSRVLAVRDMRTANGREEESGQGSGNESWIGLVLGMIVLDTLTPESDPVRARWLDLLAARGVQDDDAKIIYALRCSLLHGYGIPRRKGINGRKLFLTDDQHAYAVDTDDRDVVKVSVPVFCRCLVERIVYETPEHAWDTSLIDVTAVLPRVRRGGPGA